MTNGQFQAYLSGDPGVNYIVETSTNLAAWSTLTNLTVQNLTTTFVDTSPPPRGFIARGSIPLASRRARLPGRTSVPPSPAGTSPFSTNGIFQWAARTNGNDYLILGGTGATNGAGTYTYTVTGPNTAPISYADSSDGAQPANEQLVFTSTAAGYYYTTNAGSAGFQSGSFKMAAGPVLFLGNVRFTPDPREGASALFTARHVALAERHRCGGLCLVLEHFRGDALLTSATISMTPFAAGSIPVNRRFPSLAACNSARRESQFCDGVTLTLTTPAPLGSYATLLLMGAGDGTNLRPRADYQPGQRSYSTTFFHFSSGAASDPSDAQLAGLPEAQAACNQAESDLNVQKQQAAPPEPPDDEVKCGGNPGGDAQVR